MFEYALVCTLQVDSARIANHGVAIQQWVRLVIEADIPLGGIDVGLYWMAPHLAFGSATLEPFLKPFFIIANAISLWLFVKPLLIRGLVLYT